MASNHPPSPDLIPNPFIKKQNLQWTLSTPSPPPIDINPDGGSPPEPEPRPTTTAAIESGAVLVDDHLARFTDTLTKNTPSSYTPLLPVSSYAALYQSQAGRPDGAHFVIHQHDHPVAGTHYDLRLQINETSSVSWAIMYGLPGDPNSVRLNRNATETRIHSLWNHLIETASPQTGSLLIWDTGTYTVLPRRSKYAPAVDPSSPTASPTSSTASQQSLLHAAFQNRKIKLRLHGSKLPDPYVIYIRLTKSEDAAGRAKSLRPLKRRRTARRGATKPAPDPETSSSSDNEELEDEAVPNTSQTIESTENVSAEDRELRELEDAQVRQTNAYPGATNSIGSIHQRKWYLSLDRPACGFTEVKRSGRSHWKHAEPVKSEDDKNLDEAARLSFPFYVRGRDHEHSVVTGRRGKDILHDEGVKAFVPRQGWNPVLN